MLRSLRLENFQKHASLEVEFDSRTTIITGANWSGKSTIIRGIVYALFGPSAVPGGNKILQRRGTKKKPFAELKFSLNGKDYTAVRRGASATLFQGESKIATGASVVTEEVEHLLGYPSRLFVALRTAPQEEAASILTLGSTKLSEILNSITEVDVIDRVRDEIGSRLSELKFAVGRHQDVDLPALRQARDGAITELHQLNTGIEKKSQAVASLLSELTELQEQVTNLAEQNKEAESSKIRIAVLMRDLEAEEKSLSELREDLQNAGTMSEEQVAALWEAYEKERDHLQEMETKEQKRTSRLAVLKHEAATAEQRLEQALSVLSSLPKNSELMPGVELERLRTSANKATSAASEAAVLHRQAATALEQSVCPACKRPYEEHDMEKLQAEVEAAKEKAEALEVEVAQAKKALSDAEQYQDAALQQQRQRAQAEEDRQSAAASKKNAEEEIAGMGDAAAPDLLQLKESVLKKHEKHTEALQKLSRIALLKDSITYSENTVAAKTEELDNIPAYPADLKEQWEIADAHYRAKKQAHYELNADLTSLRHQYAASYREYETYDANVKQAEALLQSQQKELKQQDQLKRLGKYLTTNRDSFTEKVWQSLLTYASQFIEQATGGAVTAVSRDAGGNFTYQEAGEEMPIQAASGLQKAIIGTAVRLALAEAVRASSNFFLLDEVTAGASDEASMAVTNALNQTGLQIVAVTHRPADAAVADRVVSL
jgi:exonuclease SbcC